MKKKEKVVDGPMLGDCLNCGQSHTKQQQEERSNRKRKGTKN